MTPPQDALERAALLLGNGRLFYLTDSGRELDRALRDLVEEARSVKAERDRLLAERQPFKTLMDAAQEAALFTGIQATADADQRARFASEMDAASKRVSELAERLGFKRPEPKAKPLDIDELAAHGPTATAAVVFRGEPMHVGVVNLTVESDYEGSDRVTVELVGRQRRPSDGEP